MIQCPICQVLNEDGALFCAECGQRFSQASQPGQPAPAAAPSQQAPSVNQAPPAAPQMPSPPPPQAPSQENTESRQKGIKLRSPMLGGGGDDDEDQGYEQPQLGKLRGTAPKQSQSNTGRKHLRSPLLGDSDDDEDLEDSRTGRKSSEPTGDYGPGGAPRKKKLRSPLLGEDDDDDDQDFTPSDGPAQGRRPLRSPLLGQDGGGGDDGPPRMRKVPRAPTEHHAQPHAQPHKRGLHSPLLGGDDFDDYDEDDLPTREAPRKGPTGKPKLRSSLLGGGDYDEDYDDDWDDEEDDNPNVLRSPLLAAKKKRPKPEAAPPAGVFGAGQDLPPGVQVHRPEMHQPQQAAPVPDVHNWAEQNQAAQSGQHQPYQQAPAPVAAVEAPQPQTFAQVGAPPPFPGPSEPQPPWQPAPAPPGWAQGAQPQPGQPWPPGPGPAVQGGPVPGQQAATDPPLPLEPSAQAPPWQNRMSDPLPSMLDRPAGPQGDVPPIVDNNDEFELDLDPLGSTQDKVESQLTPPPGMQPLAQEAPAQAPLRGRMPSNFGKPQTEEELKDTLVDEDGPNERRRLERRRGNSDRRLSSLLDDRSSNAPPRGDDDDDFMAPRPKAAGNPMAPMMFGLGALALGVKIWFFIRVAGMWDLSKMPDFIGEQMFTGLALVGLIVFALSCMKK